MGRSNQPPAEESQLLSLIKHEPVLIVPNGGEKSSRKGFYMLSNLDQTMPYPFEILFAYENKSDANNQITDAGEILKKSLAVTVEEFYPLAGGLDVSWDGRMLVDCSGGRGGVPFVEAVCDQDMALAVGDITKLNDKLAELVYSDEKPYATILDVPPLTVQVTKFKCGGIIIGVQFNHVLMDGRAFTDLMVHWSKVARDLPISTHPHMDRSIFSATNPQKVQRSHTEYSKSKSPLIPILGPRNEHNIIRVNKSFTFTPNKISQLKKLATKNDKNTLTNNPTSFELISALVWVSWTKAMEISPKKITQIITTVDSRPKFTNPPLPKPYFGNGIVWSCARSKVSDLTSEPFSFAVRIVHEALGEVTEDYVRSAIDYHEIVRKPLEQENTLWITKWSRLGLYDVEFNWGKPTQVAPASLLDNLVMSISEGKENDNLVVSLRLPAEAMEIFQELMESEMN